MISIMISIQIFLTSCHHSLSWEGLHGHHLSHSGKISKTSAKVDKAVQEVKLSAFFAIPLAITMNLTVVTFMEKKRGVFSLFYNVTMMLLLFTN
jgi:hypothetical protein